MISLSIFNKPLLLSYPALFLSASRKARIAKGAQRPPPTDLANAPRSEMVVWHYILDGSLLLFAGIAKEEE